MTNDQETQVAKIYVKTINELAKVLASHNAYLEALLFFEHNLEIAIRVARVDADNASKN